MSFSLSTEIPNSTGWIATRRRSEKKSATRASSLLYTATPQDFAILAILARVALWKVKLSGMQDTKRNWSIDLGSVQRFHKGV